MPRYLVTGVAGFIGYHTADYLVRRGDEVIGIDNLNEYYDVGLKQARLARLANRTGFAFRKIDLGDREAIEQLFGIEKPDIVVHLAAQAGVRHSLKDPHAYAHSNLTGFLHVLEGCRHQQIRHLVYASTSSVYGANTLLPFSERHRTDHPLSLYAATKKANELMAHSYSHLYGIPTTGLRFFTVYGPWGRPDMALFRFTQAILDGAPIQVFNHGQMQRDFTYIDDIIQGMIRAVDQVPRPNLTWDGTDPDSSTSRSPWRVFNIGSDRPTNLMRYIEILEECLGFQAKRELVPMQAGDVPATWADAQALDNAVGYRPETPIEVGVQRFVDWYLSYYKVPSGLSIR